MLDQLVALTRYLDAALISMRLQWGQQVPFEQLHVHSCHVAVLGQFLSSRTWDESNESCKRCVTNAKILSTAEEWSS